MAAAPTKRKLKISQNDGPQMKTSKPCGGDIINKSATAADVMRKCDKCKIKVPALEERYSFEENRLYMHVENDTLYGIRGCKKTKDEERVKFKLEFLQLVCSLRNSRGGILFIHVEERNPHYGRSLDKFDERFEDELSRMVEDDSMYHMNYTKRDWVSLENDEYEDYIVLFIEGSKSISTQDYNTYMPHYGQIVRPKAREMAKYITDMKEKKMAVFGENTTMRFQEGEQLSFYESMDKEFKRLDENDIEEDYKREDRPHALVNKIVALKLYEYITSFSKLENGGNIFFGIEEEKKPINEVLGISAASDKATTREIARREHKRDTPTFHYIVRGIALGNAEKEAVNSILTEKIKNEMLWLKADDTMMRPDEMEEVEIRFNETTEEGTPRRYVVEVCVLRQFPGMVFTKKHGPNVYMKDKEMIKTVDVLEWKRRILT